MVQTIYVSVSNLYDNYYNNNCLFDSLLKQLFSILFVTEIFKPRLFFYT